MPYVSRAQAAKFHADPKLRKYVPEWDAATDFSKLPARAKKKKPPDELATAKQIVKRHQV